VKFQQIYFLRQIKLIAAICRMVADRSGTGRVSPEMPLEIRILLEEHGAACFRDANTFLSLRLLQEGVAPAAGPSRRATSRCADGRLRPRRVLGDAAIRLRPNFWIRG